MRNKRAQRTDNQSHSDVVDTQSKWQTTPTSTYIELLHPSAFEYVLDIEHYTLSKVEIGAMDKECPHCYAPKFKNEPAGMCCASGKV